MGFNSGFKGSNPICQVKYIPMSLDNQCMNAISGKRLSSSPVCPGWLCCPNSLPFNLMGTKDFFLQVQWLRNNNKHLLPFSAKIKNATLHYITLHYIFIPSIHFPRKPHLNIKHVNKTSIHTSQLKNIHRSSPKYYSMSSNTIIKLHSCLHY